MATRPTTIEVDIWDREARAYVHYELMLTPAEPTLLNETSVYEVSTVEGVQLGRVFRRPFNHPKRLKGKTYVAYHKDVVCWTWEIPGRRARLEADSRKDAVKKLVEDQLDLLEGAS
jgi:hypothetical protein